MYNVYDGDYPVLKGNRMLGWVFNDQTEHKLSLSAQLGLNIAVYPFGVSFGAYMPVQSVTFLSHSLDHMLHFNDNEPGTNPLSLSGPWVQQLRQWFDDGIQASGPDRAIYSSRTIDFPGCHHCGCNTIPMVHRRNDSNYSDRTTGYYYGHFAYRL